MPWSKDDMKRKHPKIDDATAERMARAATAALASCQRAGKSDCEGYAMRVANSMMSDAQKLSDEDISSVMLAPLGTWNTAKYGKMNVTRDFVDKVIENFDAKVMNERDPFIDDEHDEGASNGWFKRLYVGDVPPDHEVAKYGVKHALFGEVEWTPPGKEKLDSGVYKYISPHFGEYQDPVTGEKHAPVLKNAGFTNIPVFSMMPSLAMSEHIVEWMCSDDYDKTIVVNLAETQDAKADRQPTSPVSEDSSETARNDDMKGGNNVEETKLREILKLDESGDIDETLQALIEKAAKADDIEELTTKLEAAETKLAEADKDKDDTTKRLEAVEAELKAAKAEATERDATTFVEKALSDEKIVPAQQEAMKELYLSDKELAEKVIEAAPTIKLTEEEKGREGNAGERTAKEDTLAKHAEAVEKYLAEGMTYAKAFSLADKEVRLSDEDRFEPSEAVAH